MQSSPLPSKICRACGRSFTWRKKWERDWAHVIYCSRRCGGQKQGDASADLETRILTTLKARGRGAAVELADLLTDEERGDAARTEALRAAARRLAHGDSIEILVDNRVVSPDRARGAMRVRLR